MQMTDSVIRGGGSVVWRRGEDDKLEIALIHRPKYNDWTIPKGKCEDGESQITAAFRETIEETGFKVKFSRFLGDVEYQTDEGKKQISYWRAKFQKSVGLPIEGEVDEVRWFEVNSAVERVSHDSEKEIIQRFLESDLDSKVLIQLRHCKALARTEWEGDDSKRPLDSVGLEQSERLIQNLIPFGIEEIHSSDAVRCYESINPLAKSLSLNYFFTDSLSEIVYQRKPNRVFKYIERLLDNSNTTLICSHNPILPHYLQIKLNRQGFNVNDTFLKPGDAWIIHHIQREILAVDKLSAPTIA
jgi:8-oxo-dGTP diphosphatase